jgi:hypothetical protein
LLAPKPSTKRLIDEPEDALAACGDVNQLRLLLRSQRLCLRDCHKSQLAAIDSYDPNCITQAFATCRQSWNAVHSPCSLTTELTRAEPLMSNMKKDRHRGVE